MNKYFIAASAVALVAGTNVQAADVVTSPVNIAPSSSAVAPSFNWQGFYIGGEVGSSWGNSKSTSGNATRKVKPDGFIGGLYAGYNFDIGNNWVVGAETDFQWADVDGKLSEKAGSVTSEHQVKQKFTGATRLRGGYAVDRWLPYVSAGIAYSKFDSSGTTAGVIENKKTRAGWTASAGVDYAVTDSVLLRVEYRHADFGKKTYGSDNNRIKLKHENNNVRVGVAYKF